LIREEQGLAARVLESLGIGYEAARVQAVERYPQGEERQTGQIPFTPAAKKSLELSLREALGLGHNYLGTEHLLLGLTRAETGVFTPFGLTDDEVHQATIGAFANEPGSPYERAVDSYGGDEPWAERIEALRLEGWEITRVTVQRRRLRS
jgi:ATP-dependent Clp protease ATP-binding subunit ClpC